MYEFYALGIAVSGQICFGIYILFHDTQISIHI